MLLSLLDVFKTPPFFSQFFIKIAMEYTSLIPRGPKRSCRLRALAPAKSCIERENDDMLRSILEFSGLVSFMQLGRTCSDLRKSTTRVAKNVSFDRLLFISSPNPQTPETLKILARMSKYEIHLNGKQHKEENQLAKAALTLLSLTRQPVSSVYVFGKDRTRESMNQTCCKIRALSSLSNLTLWRVRLDGLSLHPSLKTLTLSHCSEKLSLRKQKKLAILQIHAPPKRETHLLGSVKHVPPTIRRLDFHSRVRTRTFSMIGLGEMTNGCLFTKRDCARLPGLVELDINAKYLRGCEHLKMLSNLQTLRVVSEFTPSKEWFKLGKACASLRNLQVSDTFFGECIGSVLTYENFPNLKRLHLSYLPSECAHVVLRLKGLEQLVIGFSILASRVHTLDSIGETLKKLKHVEFIFPRGVYLSSRTIRSLETLPLLETVTIKGYIVARYNNWAEKPGKSFHVYLHPDETL